MKLNISKEELEQMSYDDVAYLILKSKKKKMNIQDLFKQWLYQHQILMRIL